MVLCARGQEALDEAVAAIKGDGGEAWGLVCDVSETAGLGPLLQQTQDAAGSPDILVLNAGGPPTGAAATMSDDLWAKGYDLTLMSAVRLTRAALPQMRRQRWGRVINITSLSVKHPIANLALSNAYRAALTAFAKSLSNEIAAEGVTVNNVAPGYTATRRLQELHQDEAELQGLTQRVPAGRLATPGEVVAAAVFLASEQAAYITGQTLLVDGGFVGSLF